MKTTIDVQADYNIIADGVTDNTTGLEAMRQALAGKNKPHYVLLFPPGEIRYSNNRWLFGIYSFELVGNDTVFRSIYNGQDDAFQRPFFVGELLQNNVMNYTGTKVYVTADKFTTVNAGATTIHLSTSNNSYAAGNRVLLYAGNYHDTGYPPPASAEWHEIVSVAPGILNLKRPLEKNYSEDTWDNPVISGGGCGKPRIINLDRPENIYCKYARFTDITFGNATGGGTGSVIFAAEVLEMARCKGEGFFWPSENRIATYEDMDTDKGEFDKLVNTVICNRVNFKGSPNNGGSIDRIVINDCQAGESMRIDSREIEIRNTHIRANTNPDAWIPALSDYPARNPIRRITIESLTFSSTINSLAETHINLAPFNSLVISTTSGKNILTNDFNKVKMMEARTTVLFDENGLDGGLVTSITYQNGMFVIAGNWNSVPVAGAVWKWCHVKEIIDLGGHRLLDNKRVWDGNSIRWKGNQNAGAVKEMHLDQKDFKWISGSNGNITADLYGNIEQIELYISKPYGGTGAMINIESVSPYKQLYLCNMKTKISVPSFDGSWIKQLAFNTFNVIGAVTDDVLPKFDMLIRWKPF
jgi:hypothetical protein